MGEGRDLLSGKNMGSKPAADKKDNSIEQNKITLNYL
jgi:hypothetical protein